MPGSSNSSFIPKRNPVKKSRKTVSRRVYTFTVFSYIFLFAVLLASVGVFVYGQWIDRQLESQVAELTTEIARFNSDDLAAVKAYDARLRLAAERVANSVSVATLFSAFEAATIGTVSFERLTLEREGDEQFVVQAAIRTDSFDSSLFQRGVFSQSNRIAGVTISELQKTTATRSENENTQLLQTFIAEDAQTFVTFDATLEIGLSEFPYDPSIYRTPEAANAVTTSPATPTTTPTANLNQL